MRRARSLGSILVAVTLGVAPGARAASIVATTERSAPATGEQQVPATAAERGPESSAEEAEPLLRDPEAQAHLERGLDEFYAERFEAASMEFKAAYAIEPAPFLLYSWAQAERYLGDCGRAVELYVRFLSHDPPQDEADKARERIIDCGGTPPAPQPTPVVDVVREPPPPTPPPRWPSKPTRLGLGFGALGLVLGGGTVAGGGVVVAQARRDERAALEAMSQQAFVDQRDDARGSQRVGGVLVGAGAALLVAGAAVLGVFVVRARRERRRAAGARWRSGPRLVLRP